MPKPKQTFCCELCAFTTEKKSTYVNHLESNKHKNKLNGAASNPVSEASSEISSVTTTPDDSATALRIRELENQLKLKDLEIQNLIANHAMELKMKDLEIQHKQELISVLQNSSSRNNNNNNNETNNIKMVISEKAPTENKRASPIKQCPQLFRADAENFDACFKSMLTNTEFNDYIQETTNSKGEDVFTLTKNKLCAYDYKSNGVDNAVELISKCFLKLKPNELPFYCVNKRKNTLFIKTNDEWMKETNENQDQFDKILLKSAKDALAAIQKYTFSTMITFKEHKTAFSREYGMNYDDWFKNHYQEIMSALSLVGDNVSTKVESDQEVENKKLVVKKLKIVLSNMSISGHDSDEDDN